MIKLWLWLVTHTIAPEHSGRYFAVHVRGQADLIYSLSAGLQ